MDERNREMFKKILKIITAVLLILLILAVLRWALLSVLTDKPVCLFCYRSHLIHDYFRVTGINKKILYQPPKVSIELYGEPNSIEKEVIAENSFFEYYNYDGFAIVFWAKDDIDYYCLGFKLYSPKIKIRRDIHVGSTREQIIKAYRKCSIASVVDKDGSIVDKDESLGEAYYDTGTNRWINLVEFEYDENDIVTAIRYLP